MMFSLTSFILNFIQTTKFTAVIFDWLLHYPYVCKNYYVSIAILSIAITKFNPPPLLSFPYPFFLSCDKK